MINIVKRFFVGLLVGVIAYAIIIATIMFSFGLSDSWSFIWLLFLGPVLAIIAAIKTAITIKQPSTELILGLLISTFVLIFLYWILENV